MSSVLPGAADRFADTDPAERLVANIRSPLALISADGGTRASLVDDDGAIADPPGAHEALIGVLPPLYPEWLGDRGFLAAHGCRFPYVVGEMARGIATVEMVIAAARAGLVAFFGSAGLGMAEIETALARIAAALGPERHNWGANLIHSPQSPEAENAFAALALRQGLKAISTSAFMQLSPAVVWLSASGLKRRPDGSIERARRIFAKVSRPEVARQFLLPAPPATLRALVAAEKLTGSEAELALRIPVAEDITVEADSGGHTDNRPLAVLLPLMNALADELTARHEYAVRPRVGAGGGLGTPAAVASCFAAGAAYVVTGSVNQCTVESGLSRDARAMLAEADIADVAMAPAADMFEMGVKVQVLKRGTLFAQRGQRLYEVFRRYQSLEDLPPQERIALEDSVLGRSIDDIWADTQRYFADHDRTELARAEREPRHKMALVFRWYLFMGAHWARAGETGRRADYQIWCGPAMGAFNDWVRGSFLESLQNRDVAQIARNLLEGAARITRAHHLRLAGVPLTAQAFNFRPRPLR